MVLIMTTLEITFVSEQMFYCSKFQILRFYACSQGKSVCLLFFLNLKRSFPYHVLWRLVDADVDAADVFADEP